MKLMNYVVNRNICQCRRGEVSGTKEGIDDGMSGSIGEQTEESIGSPRKPPLPTGDGKLAVELLS